MSLRLERLKTATVHDPVKGRRRIDMNMDVVFDRCSVMGSLEDEYVYRKNSL